MTNDRAASRKFFRGQIRMCLDQANKRLCAASAQALHILHNFHDWTPEQITTQLAKLEGQRMEMIEDLRLCQKNIEELGRVGPPEVTELENQVLPGITRPDSE